MWSTQQFRRKSARSGQADRPGQRLVAIGVVFFLGLQLGRFYLTTSVNLLLCPEDSPAAATEQHVGHAGHNHAASPEHAPLDSGGGPYFQHCKDHVYGLGLTPLQFLMEPVICPYPRRGNGTVAAGHPVLARHQNDLTAPFHPPRDRS